MASATPRKDKNGKIVSYQIKVFRGRDALGKQLKPFTETWTPEEGMTPKRLEKALQKEIALFEDKCRQGKIAIEKPTFEAYARRVLERRETTETLKAKSVEQYKNILDNIICNSELSHTIAYIKLCDLKACDVNVFYEDLSKKGARQTAKKAVAKYDLLKHLKSKKIKMVDIAAETGLTLQAVSRAIHQETVLLDTAERICKNINEKTADLFDTIVDDSKLSGTYLQLIHAFISMVLSSATKEGLTTENVAEKATPPKKDTEEATALTLEEIQKVLHAVENDSLKWKLAIYLLAFSGARRGEICGLRWTDVNFDKCMIHFTNNAVYVRKVGIINNTLKTNESRSVTVSSVVIDMLKEYKKSQAREFSNAGIIPAAGFIFVDTNGKQISPNTLGNYLHILSKKLGIPNLHAHAFRHSQASLLINAGTDITTVSKRLGHKKVTTTLNLYSHILATADETASNKIDDLISKQA